LVLDDFSEEDVFYKDKVNKTIMGRFGNIMMINNDENFVLEVNQYDTRRFFVTNVANTRTFDFKIENQKLKMVGGDIGRVEKEYMVDNFIIAPAERYIFETRFDKAGEFTIKSKNRVLGKIVVKKSDIMIKQSAYGVKLRNNSEDYKNIRENFNKFLTQKTDKKLRLTIAMKGMEMDGGAMEMRRGQEHKDGGGKMMGGTLDDLMKKEMELGGDINMMKEDNNSIE
jgi:FtsP/CotA-like multicopper oxidase with cupredoxin domain